MTRAGRAAKARDAVLAAGGTADDAAKAFQAFFSGAEHSERAPSTEYRRYNGYDAVRISEDDAP